MLAFWLGVSIAAQEQPAVKVETTRCEDGTIIQKTDKCPFMSDHRYGYSHTPHRQNESLRWWCGQEKRPSEYVVTMEYGRSRGSGNGPKFRNRIDRLIVNGKPASTKLLSDVRQKLASLEQLYVMTGRCIYVRSEEIVPELGISGITNENGKIERKYFRINLE